MPARIAEILPLVQTLTAYGRRLSDLITRPKAWIGFVMIARFFGTSAIPDIAARVQRGLMRLSALEAMLLQRAKRGADLVIPAPTTRAPRKARPAAKPQQYQIPDQPSLDTLPTLQEIMAEVRRRPIGRTIAAIILDMGLAPATCEGALWHRLQDAMQAYKGSLANVIKEVRRRVDRFESQEHSNDPLLWPDRIPDRIHPFPTFFVSRQPFHPPPAATAGPS